MISSYDQKFISLQIRCKGGSLPLKKRRFSAMSDTEPFSHSTVSVQGEDFSFSDGKLAALSLIASTASAIESEEDPVPDATATDSSEDPVTDLEEKSISSVSIKIHSVANGEMPPRGSCHGRTSRNNSFCKRHPCYKGSQFCKLHYQQQILAEASLKLPEEDSDICKQVTTSSASLGDRKQGTFQDKRFTGSSGEIRCKATTTRGRECAYVAVSGSKYCFLHADYDTNPPPRRGGGGSSSKKFSSTPNNQFTDSESNGEKKVAPDLQPTSSFSSESSLAGNARGSRDTSSVKSKGNAERSKKRGSSTKIARKHMDSPFPLLSMISTDQWALKRVKISVGPLTDRIGTVEKWSNGWVSVRVDGVGLHNRRSFELFLLEESEDKSQMSGSDCSVKSYSCDGASSGVTRLTPSPPAVATENCSAAKTIRTSVKAPLTPYSQDRSNWPVTPGASTNAPLVPLVTPNSPRKAACPSTDNGIAKDITGGIFLTDSGGKQPAIPLHLRLGPFQEHLGGVTSISSKRGGKGPN